MKKNSSTVTVVETPKRRGRPRKNAVAEAVVAQPATAPKKRGRKPAAESKVATRKVTSGAKPQKLTLKPALKVLKDSNRAIKAYKEVMKTVAKLSSEVLSTHDTAYIQKYQKLLKHFKFKVTEANELCSELKPIKLRVKQLKAKKAAKAESGQPTESTASAEEVKPRKRGRKARAKVSEPAAAESDDADGRAVATASQEPVAEVQQPQENVTAEPVEEQVEEQVEDEAEESKLEDEIEELEDSIEKDEDEDEEEDEEDFEDHSRDRDDLFDEDTRSEYGIRDRFEALADMESEMRANGDWD